MKKITTKKFIKFKKAEILRPILKVVRNRFSPRFFGPEKISERELGSMFEAARWAPSAYNFQPWYFYWDPKGNEAYQNIFSSLADRNQSWANSAQIFIVACYLKEKDGGTNKFRKYDLGAAVMSLVLQAQSMGIYARQMGLFDAEKVQSIFNIPKEETPLIVIALGKIGDYSKGSAELLEKEMQKRERKTDIVKKL